MTDQKNPILLIEKWGFHDWAILAPPQGGRRKPGKKALSSKPDAVNLP
jgi:hypothetical protein